MASPEKVMRQTGMSEDELTRRFLEHLIQEGKNPFFDLPERFRGEMEAKYPDLLDLSRRKFGGPSSLLKKSHFRANRFVGDFEKIRRLRAGCSGQLT